MLSTRNERGSALSQSWYAIAPLPDGALDIYEDRRQVAGLYRIAQSGSGSTPDEFTFTDQVDQNPSTVIASNTITVAGLGAPATCSFVETGHTTGEYNLNSGGWLDLASFTIDNSDMLQIRLTSGAFTSTRSIEVTIGTLSDLWEVTATTEPTLLTAISTDTALTLKFNKPISIGAGGNGGFTASMSGGAATLTYSSGDGTDELVYTWSRTIDPDETGTLDYTQPGDGLEDSGGNDVASFSTFTIIIGSELQFNDPGIRHKNPNRRHQDRTLAFNETSLEHNE